MAGRISGESGLGGGGGAMGTAFRMVAPSTSIAAEVGALPEVLPREAGIVSLAGRAGSLKTGRPVSKASTRPEARLLKLNEEELPEGGVPSQR